MKFEIGDEVEVIEDISMYSGLRGEIVFINDESLFSNGDDAVHVVFNSTELKFEAHELKKLED